MKKQLSTVKGKVVAGAIAITLVSGAGFVAANTDAGAALQGWYNNAFGKASGEMVKDTAGYGLNKTGEFGEHAAAETKAGVTAVLDKKNEEKAAKTESIHSAKQAHIAAVDGKQAEISAYMDDQFDQLSKASIDTFNFTSNGIYKGADFAMSTTINLTGSAAFENLEKELNAEKREAVSELEQRIASAKEALLGQLKSEKDATTAEIKGAIDEQIAKLKADITAKKDELVKKHEDKLIAKANEIEAAAKAELDSVVSGI